MAAHAPTHTSLFSICLAWFVPALFISLCLCFVCVHNTLPSQTPIQSPSLGILRILSFSRERVLQLLFFDVDCRRCCVYALSLHMYVAMTTHPHSTHKEHTDSHTQHTHTQRCAHKWINWRAAWWPVTINEPLTSKKRVTAIYDDNNEQQSILSKRTLYTATLYI